MKLIFTSLLIISLGCSSIDRTKSLMNSEETKTLKIFKQLDPKHCATIAIDQEEGTPLLLCLTFIAKETSLPLKKQRVLFYQADNEGEYNQTDPEDESTARLHDTAVTNELGQIFVKTVLPGDYGSTADNRHIHTTVYGAKPEAYDIHFLQYANTGLQNFIAKSDQHFLADLRYTMDSTLVGFLTIEPKFKKKK